MKEKSNLKAVKSEQEDTMYKYTFDQMGDVAAHLYFTEAALDVLSAVDACDTLKNPASISTLASHARDKIAAALDILKP